jgi:predicted TIM-barrel fold metal-dependent hydrolase
VGRAGPDLPSPTGLTRWAGDRRTLLHPGILATGQKALREYVLGPTVTFPFDPTLAVARMCYAVIFRDFPRVRRIIAHAGGTVPWLMERLDNGWRDVANNRASTSCPASM